MTLPDRAGHLLAEDLQGIGLDDWANAARPFSGGLVEILKKVNRSSCIQPEHVHIMALIY
jgi:hypothetical protein